MATIIRDGFDFYATTAEGNTLWSSLSNCTLSASSRFAVGQSLALVTSGLTGDINFQHTFGFNSTDTLILNFALRRTSGITGATTGEHRFLFLDDATVQFSFTIDENGGMRFFRGNVATLLGTYSGAFAGGGSWNHFQIKIVISDAVGSFEVRRDGSDFNDFEVLSVDTKITANSFINSVQCVCGQNNPAAHQIDDFWLLDSSVVAGEPSNWIGDVRAVQIMPNSDSIASFGRSAGSTNFSNVDELIASSADYVFGSTPGQADEYGNAGFVAPVPDVIQGLSVRLVALKTDAGPRTVGSRIRTNGVAAEGAGRTITAAARSYVYRHDLNPDTGVAWTAAEIAAMTFGPRIAT